MRFSLKYCFNVTIVLFDKKGIAKYRTVKNHKIVFQTLKHHCKLIAVAKLINP